MTDFRLEGNSLVWHNLVNDRLRNKIAHAYIFSGAKGLGKSLTAKKYIKYILNADSYLEKRIDDNSFLDLLYISKQENNEITIDVIRQAQDFLSCTPAEGNKKFVIIDSADDLNINSSNALLKILEEPKSNTYLFLISHKPYKLLPTIRSRCRIVRFSPLSEGEMKLIANMNKFTQIEDLLSGSPGKAINFEEHDIKELYITIINLIINDNIIDYNSFTDQLSKDKWEIITSHILQYIFNRLMKLKSYCVDTELLLEVEKEILLPLSETRSISQWYDIYQECSKMLTNAVNFNLDKKQILLLIFKEIKN